MVMTNGFCANGNNYIMVYEVHLPKGGAKMH